MKKLLNFAVIAIALSTATAVAYDSDYPDECANLFDLAMNAKGTKQQDETFHKFQECVDNALEIEQPLCYSLTGAFIGKYDYSCSLPTYIESRG